MMVDREKVISGLECCIAGNCDECEYEKDGCLDNLNTFMSGLKRDALALLKTQEAVEPVLDIDTWTCGNCGHVLEHQQLLGDNVLLHEQYNYCPDCGKAVKWE